MHKLNFFIALGLLVLLLPSCRDLVDKEAPDFDPLPAINSIIVQGQPIEAHISLASPLDTMQMRGIENASVALFEDDVFIGLMQHAQNGWFTTPHIAQAGKSYSFHLNMEGHETVKASCTLPLPSALLGFEHISIAGKNNEGLTYPAISFTFENNPSQDLYFEARIRLFTYWEDESEAFLINIIDPVLLNEGLPLKLFRNTIITGNTYTMTINYGTGSSSSTGQGGLWNTTLFPLILELRSVSKEYYLFSRQKYLYDSGRFPEFGLNPQAAYPLYSNVEGGYGIVAGYSMVATDTIFPSY